MNTPVKISILVLSLISVLSFSSCDVVVVNNTPGPYGYNGLAFFGVDYEMHPPYSYWDNNNSIPYNPDLGYYYETAPGIYEFEYFINPEEYWYGTYEVWINYGQEGGPYGERGADGMNTYLMLICDPNGYHTHFDEGYKTNHDVVSDTIPVVIERKEGKLNYRLTIQKGNVKDRPAHDPKYVASPQPSPKEREFEETTTR
jgi:hypothetical protein